MLARRALRLIVMLSNACTPNGPPPVASQPAAARAPTPMSAPTPAGSAATAPRVLLPVDEATRDPSFLAFRDSLIQIVKRKDRAALLAVIDPAGIESSFGGDGTLAEFNDMWKLDRPDSELWPTLQAVLSMGGAFTSDGDFLAPYVFASFPRDLDCCWLAITAADVPLLTERRDDAPVRTRLSYTIVRVPDAAQDG
jgi:hypothetical protein